MSKRVYRDRKGSRESIGRADRPRKRAAPLNRYTIEKEEDSTIKSAKKLKYRSCSVSIDASHGYRVLNFVQVFSAISEHVKCKDCGGAVKFLESSTRGLGFKIVVTCDVCEQRSVNSCPLIENRAYEINRRFVFATRLLGIDLQGIKQFCGIMDLPKPLHPAVYDAVLNNVHCASKSVCELSLQRAGKMELSLSAKENTPGLVVSAIGISRQSGFSSIQTVASLVGNRGRKVLDIAVKSANCEACESWEGREDSEEYEEWRKEHANNCSIAREKSDGKMELNAHLEMFRRSDELHGTRYLSCVGDYSCDTFAALFDEKPYGNDVIIQKKEYVERARRHMRSKLRIAKMTNERITNRLSAQLVDELCNDYASAIQKHCHSVEEMKKAVWATFSHRCSTDDNPQHGNCPNGTTSTCSWRRAEAEGNLQEYKHDLPLHEEVQSIVIRVYEELNSDEFLQRYLGGFAQIPDTTKHLDSLVWKIASKDLTTNDTRMLDIGAYVAASTFNDGLNSLLQMMQVMHITIGPHASDMCMEEDASRGIILDEDVPEFIKETGLHRSPANEASTATESSMQDTGID